MPILTLSDITADKRGTRKTTVQNYGINLGTIKVIKNARERRSSRATATIVGNPSIRSLIVVRNTPRINQLNIRRMMPATLMWTFWSRIIKYWTSWILRKNYS